MGSKNRVDIVYYLQVSVPEGADLGELMEEGLADYMHEYLAPEGLWASRTLASFDYNEFQGGWLDDGLDLAYELSRAQSFLGEAGIAVHHGQLAVVFWYDAADRPFPKGESGHVGPDDFLLTLYKLGAENQEAAEDLVHDWFDDRFLLGKFAECNTALGLVLPSRLNAELCVTLLSVTLPAKEELPLRPNFVENMRDALNEKLKDPPRVANLMRHLA